MPGDKVLVSRTDRLGDLVLALPFIESLAGRYPDNHIDVIASLYASPILENNKSVRHIIRVQYDQLRGSRNYKKDLLHRIRKGQYQLVVVLYPERQISRLFHQAEIPFRIGTAGRFHSVFFNVRFLHSRKANRKHESGYNLDFLKLFDDGHTVTAPNVYLTEQELAHARRLISAAGVFDRFVVVHPGSGGSAERWPFEHFLRLAPQLERQGIPTLVTGSASEEEEIAAAARRVGVKIRQIAGQTDVRSLAAVLSLASVVVANSTGPLHLAAAVGTKVVGLYPSKRVMSPVRWGPLGDGHVVIQPDMPGCTCPAGNCRCMETISAEKVVSAVSSVLEQVCR